MFRPKINVSGLVADLETNPFIEHILGFTSSKVYHQFSVALAPLSVALITLQHCAAIGQNAHQLILLTK